MPKNKPIKQRKRGLVSILERWNDNGILLLRARPGGDPKQRFLADEFFSMTLQATVQHSLTYKQGINTEHKLTFQRALKEALERYVAQYSTQVSEDEHIQNIKNLADEISFSVPDCLDNSRFRIGSAQKALNLYLKYLWTIGKIPMPPHCPLDSVVINQLAMGEHAKWTQLDNLDGYAALIAKAKDAANGVPLALWELQLYNNAQSEK